MTADTDALAAPWTPEQVTALNDYQRRREFHPFTCANRGAGHAPINSVDDVLVATVRGWVCPFCDYTQDWAHPFMAKPGVRVAPAPDGLRDLRIARMRSMTETGASPQEVAAYSAGWLAALAATPASPTLHDDWCDGSGSSAGGACCRRSASPTAASPSSGSVSPEAPRPAALSGERLGLALHKRLAHSNKFGSGRCRCWGEGLVIAAEYARLATEGPSA